MSSIGINIARDGSAPVETVRSLGATWARIVAMPEHDLSDYFRDLRSAGVKILMVLARESGGDYARYQRLYGSLVDAVQIGNEPDAAPDSPSSWTMTQAEFVSLGKAARAIFPRPFPIVTAGLVSGHPEWLAGVDLTWADAIAFHPYLRDAPNPADLEDLADVDGLVTGYGAYGLPLLVTEYGWWDDAEPRASEETRDMVRWAGQSGDIEALMWFCYSDQTMVPPFGLLDGAGHEKPRAKVFRQEAAKAIHSLWPAVTVPPVEPPKPALPDPWQWWDARTIAATIRCPEAAVQAQWPRIVEQMGHCGIYEMPIAAAMLGTVAIETAHQFQPIHEFRNPDGSIPDVWWTYDGGPEFHGRGFIQLTHRSNYQRYSVAISELWGTEIVPDPQLDLVAVPDRALDPDISAAVSALYFRDHSGGAIPPAARAGNWREVRRLVQGGSAGLGDFTLYASTLVSLAAGRPADPIPPVDDRDEKIAAYELALRTLRDRTIPDARAQLDEIDRIVRQFIGAV